MYGSHQMLQTFSSFINKTVIAKNVLLKNKVLINKMDIIKLKILFININEYYWSINNRLILCKLSSIGNNDINNLITILGTIKIRHMTGGSLLPFTHDNGPSDVMINYMIPSQKRFDNNIIKQLDNKSLIIFLNDTTNSLSLIVKKHDRQTIGMSFINIRNIVTVLRGIFSTCYEILLEGMNILTCQNDLLMSINSKIKTYHKVSSFGTICKQLVDKFNILINDDMLKSVGITLFTFIWRISQVFENDELSLEKFRKEVLCMVYFNGISKRKTQKRPKVKRMTFRDKRPSSIITTLPYKMPNYKKRKRR